MTDLYLHSRPVQTVFDLLGDKENDITYSVGWALAQSPTFCAKFVEAILPRRDTGEVSAIHLQESGKDKGFTDIEIVTEVAHIIVEAKRGWNVPTLQQLARYTPRLKAHPISYIVVLAECSPEYAQQRLPKHINGIPVQYRSWQQIDLLAQYSYRKGNHAEKRLLLDLDTYLRGLISMQPQDSNYVYVVALSDDVAQWSELSWIEFVTKKKFYWHPFGGNGWPTEPPNYLGFRYYGQLQSIHHIKSYKVVDDLADYIPEINRKLWKQDKGSDSYILYQLGPAIRPSRVVKTGGLYANGRVWAALDLLLTSKTIREASKLTKKRFVEVS